MNGYRSYDGYGYDRNREIREAVDAGERALSSLRTAEARLNSASTWGFLDLFGGNFITGLIKHSQVNDASRYVDAARRDLAAFRNELSDIQDLQGLDVRVGDFLTFADFFWDGLLADLLVQSRINDARRKIADAIRRTEDVVQRLKRSL